VKAKPSFHKRTFLKPEVHRSSEFCGACHKVFLPEALNDYKWLRGQNHYDPFLHSGRSGHGVLGWYYPERAATECNACHMKPVASTDFAARDRDGSGVRTALSHAFPSGNTALASTIDMCASAILAGASESELGPALAAEDAAAARARVLKETAAFNEKTLRVDLFAVREGGAIDGALRVIRPELPVLEAGRRYLLEVVVRTLDIGHPFTQGTADSNEAWLFARATSGGREIGSTGGMADDGTLDPWSRMFNAFVIDREGQRIDRRNPQDIFLPLYDNQIPPGAGDVTHLVLEVPADARAPVSIETEVRYRKFDTGYLRYVFQDERANDLPVLVLARDSVALPVRDADGVVHGAANAEKSRIPEWQRWYDYGIGLFREGDRGAGRGALRQAEEAFARVESLAPAVGALARARLEVKEGRLDDAAGSLARASDAAAAAGAVGVSPWGAAYFTALVDKQNGNFDKAILGFERVLRTDFAGARERGFDFSIDTRVLNELAETALEKRDAPLALSAVDRSLAVDPEQAQAWWLQNRALELAGDAGGAAAARAEHAKYKPDENARDRAVRLARERYPWANAAAEATVLYSLVREDRLRGDLRPGTRVEVPGLAR
jgi:tetratricopeptide (TPR) repeat protein